MTQIKNNLETIKITKQTQKNCMLSNQKDIVKENKQSYLKRTNGIPESPKLAPIFEAHIQQKEGGNYEQSE